MSTLPHPRGGNYHIHFETRPAAGTSSRQKKSKGNITEARVRYKVTENTEALLLVGLGPWLVIAGVNDAHEAQLEVHLSRRQPLRYCHPLLISIANVLAALQSLDTMYKH